MSESLIIVGAGPKALAVAAKATVLRALGMPAPQIVIVESHAVGGNWLPGGGWTDGNHRLGTSPEKDVGFPYKSQLEPGRNRDIDTRLMAFSWTSFLVEHGTYSEWIDRGRPHPQHHLWAKYLQWVASKVDAQIHIGEVTKVSAAGRQWVVTAGTHEFRSDALMFTGPGSSRKPLAEHPRVLGIAEFWDLAGRRQLPVSSRAAVIGGGETAGSALDELSRHDAMTISVISPMPTLYTRGESYFENAMFSDPTKWSSLGDTERRELIRRTDRGVFSVRVQEALLADNRIHHVQGRVTRVQSRGDMVELTLTNERRNEQTQQFDLVVDATGGQPLWFLDLFDAEAADLLELAVGWPVSQAAIESAIGYDLAVTKLAPKLHLPNLAAFAQGPGFPNLSCLGALSDRILRPEAARSATRDYAESAGAQR